MKRLALLIIILTLARFVNATTWNDGVVHDLDYIIDSYLQISGTTTVNVYAGGGTTKWIYSQHNSKLNIFDGTFGEGLSVGDNSVAIVHSGFFGSRTNTDFCIVVNDQSITTIYGGTYSGTIRLYGYPGDNPTLEFHGANFQIGGQDVSGLIDAEELALTGALSTVTSDGAVRSYGGILTGALQDGSILNNMLEITCAGENQANLILTPAPIPLVADAGPNQTVKDINNDGSEEVTLDGSGSTSIGRSIVNWVWTDDLGDTIPDGEIVTAPLSLGVHTITLTVTDDDGLTDSDTVVIIVKPQATIEPVAHWPFDLDASDIESGFNGTFEGSAAVTNTPGEYRIGTGALTLDGVDDRVSTPYAGISGAAARTTCAWFKCDGTTANTKQSIFSYGGSSVAGSGWRVWINNADGSIINAMSGGNANSATTGLTDGQWHHVAVTFPAGGTLIEDVKIYLDGYEDTAWYTNGDTQAVNTSTDNAFEIGMAEGGTRFPFDGNIDDVRVYDRALTDTEILAMQDERPISDPVIGLSDSNLYFLSELSGPNPAEQVFSVQNSGGGILNWQINESISWVSVSPDSGISTGEADTVSVSTNMTGLTGGFYSGDLIISSPGAINNPQLVTVNLYIAEADDLIVPSEYPTIQSAINAASNGDTVVVADGTYTGNGNRDISFYGKAITVRSAYGPESCIIDCENNGRAFSFYNGDSSNSQLIGFTMRNGYLENDHGGAIHIEFSSPTISQCIFENNTAVSTITGHMAFGGAFDCSYYSSPVISECVFRNNYGGWGGAVCLRLDVSPQFERCHFIDNITQHLGGGLHIASRVDVTLRNCLFNGNGGGSQGSAIWNYASDLQILNSTFYGNKKSDGVIFQRNGGDGGSLTIKNTIMWDAGVQEIRIKNASDDVVQVSYSNILGSWPGEGNISLIPHFVDPDNDNYRLMPTSPCIDAGDPEFVADPDATDIDGKPRVIGGRVDIGAYEFNHIPVADAGDDIVVYAGVDGLATVQLDGLGSSDEDGDELTYFWYEGGEQIAVGVEPDVVLAVGDHLIELIVNDGVKDSEVDSCLVTVVEAVEVSMKFTPQAVNLFARGKWVMGHIVLPAGFSVADVDAGAGARLEPFGVDSHDVDVFVNDDGMIEVEAVFDRSQLWGYAANGPTVEVTVSGKFVSGQCFYGRDTIKITRMLEYFEKISLHWLEMDCGAPDWCDGVDADHSSVVDMGDLILNE